MRFYTWKDIERYILMHHDEWKDELYDIEVYPNEMVVYPKSEQGTLQNAVLKKLFPKNIAPDNLSIKLDGQGEDLMILYEYEYSPVTVLYIRRTRKRNLYRKTASDHYKTNL